MSLKIDIDTPDAEYTIDSAVTGTISLVGDADVGTQAIIMQLVCIISTSIQALDSGGVPQLGSPCQHWANDLFSLQKVIIRGPEVLHAPRRWPFEFVFPEIALPPSCHGSGVASISLDSFSITYKLKAYRYAPLYTKHYLFHSDSEPTETAVEVLPFVLTRPKDNPDPMMVDRGQDFTCKSLHLLTGYESKPWTERMKLHLHHSKCPKVSFKIDVKLPSVVVIGQVFPCLLSLERKTNIERESTPSIPPAILLTSIRVELQEITSLLRGDNCGVDHWTKYQTLASKTFQDGSEYLIPMDDSVDIGKMLKPMVPLGFVPTFDAGEVRRTHLITTTVSVECAGKSFEADLEAEVVLLTDRCV